MSQSASSSTAVFLVDADSLDAAAAHDLTHICEYSEERDGPAAARRLALRIYGDIGQLAKFPHSGRPGRKPDTRELVFAGLPFLAVYRVRGEVVEIGRILHGAQKWP